VEWLRSFVGRGAPQWPLLCRFLDAGNNETLHTLSDPASKKRQGTKSRAVGQRLGSERYGDLMLAPTWMVRATRARRRMHVCTCWRSRECGGHFGGHAECING
jgi:hypothetical protein